MDIPPGTIPELFFETLADHAKIDALKYRAGGAWHAISHREIARDVRSLALGLRTLDLETGDRVAILSENRPEWLIADFACAVSGLVSVPLYPMLPAEQLEHMLTDSEARAVFVSTAEQLEKIRELRETVPSLESVILFDAVAGDREEFLHLQEVYGRGMERVGELDDESYRRRARQVGPDDLLTLIYTSGTTGRPKGVMLTHDNLVSNIRSVLSLLPIGPDDVSLSYLPLSHIFERMAGQYALFRAGVTICYAEEVSRVAPYLREVRPTVMTSVPRGYEKMFERIEEVAGEKGRFQERAVEWAWRVGVEHARRELAGGSTGPWLGVQRKIADRLVYSRLRAATGDRIRFFVSGGAPLDPDLARFFYSAGLPILQGYGLTEASPVVATNTLDEFRIGSVGKPIPNVEIAIREDGEIVTRGPHVMKGYYRLPEETESTLEAEGWLRTGDIGRLDDDDFLYVTDRKKELIKTSGGKYVAPQPIESRARAHRYVSQAVLVGEQRKFPALLIVPDFDALERWAREQGLEVSDRDGLVAHPRAHRFLEKEILGSLADRARYERPKKLALLPRELTVEDGELTPTLKVKRRVVREKFGDVIESIYTSDDSD